MATDESMNRDGPCCACTEHATSSRLHTGLPIGRTGECGQSCDGEIPTRLYYYHYYYTESELLYQIIDLIALHVHVLADLPTQCTRAATCVQYDYLLAHTVGGGRTRGP